MLLASEKFAVDASKVARFPGMLVLTKSGWNMPFGPYFPVLGSAMGLHLSEIV